MPRSMVGHCQERPGLGHALALIQPTDRISKPTGAVECRAEGRQGSRFFGSRSTLRGHACQLDYEIVSVDSIPSQHAGPGHSIQRGRLGAPAEAVEELGGFTRGTIAISGGDEGHDQLIAGPDLEIEEIRAVGQVGNGLAEVVRGPFRHGSGQAKSPPIVPDLAVERAGPDGLVEFGLGRDPLLPLHPGTGTGGRIAAEEDRVEQPFVTIGGDTTKLVESLSFPSPGRIVEDSHRSLSVDLQTGHRRHPRGEARQVVRELGGPVPESCGVGARPVLGEFVGISPSSFAVGVGREDRLPVGAEGQERNPVRVLHGSADGLAGRGVPEPRLPVPATGQHGLPIGAEGDRQDLITMFQGLSQSLARIRVPEPRRSHPGYR